MKLVGAIVLSALLVGSRVSAIAETKRLRTQAVYKSKAGSARSQNASSGGGFGNTASSAEQRDLQGFLVSGSLSIPIVNLPFSINISLGGGGMIAVKPAPGTKDDEDFDPFLGMGSLSMSMIVSDAPTTATSSPSPSLTPMCSFCPGGLVQENDFIVPNTDGTTCWQATNYAATLEESSEACADIRFGEIICCPSTNDIEVPCDFCTSNGITAGENFVIPNSDGTTCGLAVFYAASLEGNTETCDNIQLAEPACCPSFSEPCSFCPEGLTVDPNFVLPTDEGTTCGMALGYASTTSAEDEMCPTIQFAEQLCCPEVAEVPKDPEVDINESLSMDTSIAMEPSPAPSKSTTPIATISPPVGFVESPTKMPVAPPASSTTSPTPMSPPSSSMMMGSSLLAVSIAAIAVLQLM